MYFILIQADLAFGLFKAPFHGPAATSHLYHSVQGGFRRGKHDVCGALCRIAQTPADQKPPTPVGGQRRGQGEPPPVIPPGTFGPVTSPQPTPALLLHHRQEHFDLPLAAGTPDIFFPRDGEDLRLGTRLPPLPQPSIIPVHALPGHPGGQHGRVACTLSHLLCELRLGRTGVRRRNPGARATHHVVGPLLGQRQFPIQPDVALRARIGQKHPHLALLNATCRTPLLPCDSGRMQAFLEKPRLIHDEHSLGIAQMLDHIGA